MTPEPSTGRVLLQRIGEQRIAAGHLWIYAGEISDVKGSPAAGDIVDVHTQAGRSIGRGFFNPPSKIRVRLLTFDEEAIDEHFWAARLRRANELRRKVVSETNAYRLVHGESDFLPGLIVDRYADLLVMQTLSFGLDRRKDMLADLLAATEPEAIYVRNDLKAGRWKAYRCLKVFFKVGEPPRWTSMKASLDSRSMSSEARRPGGSATSARARRAVAAIGQGHGCLGSLLPYGSVWNSSRAAWSAVGIGIDASADALKSASRHGDVNGVGAVCRYQKADAFDALRTLARTDRRFDMVILDPPAFAVNTPSPMLWQGIRTSTCKRFG